MIGASGNTLSSLSSFAFDSAAGTGSALAVSSTSMPSDFLAPPEGSIGSSSVGSLSTDGSSAAGPTHSLRTPSTSSYMPVNYDLQSLENDPDSPVWEEGSVSAAAGSVFESMGSVDHDTAPKSPSRPHHAPLFVRNDSGTLVSPTRPVPLLHAEPVKKFRLRQSPDTPVTRKTRKARGRAESFPPVESERLLRVQAARELDSAIKGLQAQSSHAVVGRILTHLTLAQVHLHTPGAIADWYQDTVKPLLAEAEVYLRRVTSATVHEEVLQKRVVESSKPELMARLQTAIRTLKPGLVGGDLKRKLERQKLMADSIPFTTWQMGVVPFLIQAEAMIEAQKAVVGEIKEAKPVDKAHEAVATSDDGKRGGGASSVAVAASASVVADDI